MYNLVFYQKIAGVEKEGQICVNPSFRLELNSPSARREVIKTLIIISGHKGQLYEGGVRGVGFINSPLLRQSGISHNK